MCRAAPQLFFWDPVYIGIISLHVPSDDGSIVLALILYTFSTETKNKEPDQWTYHIM